MEGVNEGKWDFLFPSFLFLLLLEERGEGVGGRWYQ